LLIISCFAVFSSFSSPFILTSPSKYLSVQISILHGKIHYEASFNGEKILDPSTLGLVFQNQDSLVNFNLVKTETQTVGTSWRPVWGQSNIIQNHYNELKLFLTDKTKNRPLNIIFRAYNDGFAYRYEYPDNSQPIAIMSELSEFAFAQNNSCWWIWADYNTLEKLYQKTKISEASHVAAPFTMKTAKGNYLSIYEAALDHYSSMTLRQQPADKQHFIVNLVRWADSVAVKTNGSFTTPWRCVQTATNAGQLMESSLILNLNTPAETQDYSWIKPINYIGIWWEMHLGISEWGMKNNRHGATTENTKRYIDFAAENGIQGVLIEGWNTGWEDWGKTDAFDYVTPYADFNIREVVAYAKSKNIEIIGHHETGGDIVSYEKSLEKALEFYHSLGIKYVKTGYAGPVNPPSEHHHGQYMVDHYNKVMRMAMKYHIMLDVHEPIIPSGLSRTYPNLMTFEGVRGMEWNAWSEGNPPSHTCILPFTRALAGPMDYTPGIFNIKLDKFASKRTKWNALDNGKSSVHSTLSNQLALMVVLYSPLQMASDMIENYKGHPAFQFVSNMPTTWDETRVLEAEIGEYVVVARRSGNKWYIAGITNEENRTIILDFKFLPKDKTYNYRICSDTKESHYETNPEAYQIDRKTISANDKMALFMANGGGFLMIVE
jgi:alpha-glucosidase